LITPTNKVSRGTNFRRALLSHLSIEEAIEKGLKKFVNKQEELLGVQGILSEWKAKVLLFVQKRTCASFVVQTSSDSSFVCSFRRSGSPKDSPKVLGH
jgi:hypothetical protein